MAESKEKKWWNWEKHTWDKGKGNDWGRGDWDSDEHPGRLHMPCDSHASEPYYDESANSSKTLKKQAREGDDEIAERKKKARAEAKAEARAKKKAKAQAKKKAKRRRRMRQRRR